MIYWIKSNISLGSSRFDCVWSRIVCFVFLQSNRDVV